MNKSRLFHRVFKRLFMRFLSLRLAFLLTSGEIKPFYLMRDLILALDVLLSHGIRLVMLSAFLRLIFFRKIHAPFLNESLVMLLIAAYLLLKVEKRESAKHRLRPFWIEDINIGSAKTLRGNALIGHMFLDNVGGAWDEDSNKKTREKICAATLWLEQQAATYDVQVKIVNRFLDDVKIRFDRSIPTRKNHAQFKREFEAALQPAMMRLTDHASTSGVKPDSYCLLVHVLEDVRSYAVPARVGMDSTKRDVEYCVCAKHIGSGGYVHEILHLFGADDFYAEFHKKLQDYRREFLNGSIMFSCESLHNVRVDELTAQNIGWL